MRTHVNPTDRGVVSPSTRLDRAASAARPGCGPTSKQYAGMPRDVSPQLGVDSTGGSRGTAWDIPPDHASGARLAGLALGFDAPSDRS